MAHGKMVAAMGLVLLALVSSAWADERPEGRPPQPPVGPGPIPMMRELADQLRARAREAQELSDRLHRQAEELDQMAQRMMERGPGPERMEQVKRELDEIKEAIGRAEREGRRQEAEELRRHAEQLGQRLRPMPPGPRLAEREEIKRQIERLRDEARRAKEQGRVEDSERVRREADRLEQALREQGPREGDEFGKPMLPEGERQEIKRQVERLRGEAQRAKEEGRVEDSRNVWQEADRLEQQLREDRMDDARPLKEQKRQDRVPRDRPLKDEVARGIEALKQEIGRLWQAVNEMRNRPREER